MRTVRRLYFYLLALIGAEAIVWGAVALLRTIINNSSINGTTEIATGLSAVLVGIPVFLFHWLSAQRDALRDEEERTSRIRAVFLYAARAAFLVPVVYSTLALFNRWLTAALGLSISQAMFGNSQSNADNLAAIMVCLSAYYFFSRILDRDERAALPAAFLPETRRLYRYLWTVFGLVIVIGGVQSLLRYLLYLPAGPATASPVLLATGLALTVVGAPLWAWTWLLVQGSLDQPVERRSLLRLLVLHLITLAGVAGVMAAGGSVLSGIFAWLFGRPQTLAGFLTDTGAYIAAGIPLAVVWSYYGRVLEIEMEAMAAQPRREAVQRFYRSILSALGLAVVFTGLLVLIELLVDLLLSTTIGNEWNRISTALSALGVGLPLWLSTWPGLQQEAAGRDERSDRARRSVIRRAYLYLAIFTLVVGGMVVAGDLFYRLLSHLLSQSGWDVGRISLQRLLTLGMIAVFLTYHLRVLRADGKAAQQSLGVLHAAFPALVLLENDLPLAEELSRELTRQAPRLPLMIHHIDQGAPDDEFLSARVILLTAGLAVDPPEALRLWLRASQAKRLVLPLAREGWTWVGVGLNPIREVAHDAAGAIRQMAEGEAPRAGLPANPWSVVGYIFGGLFALQVLIALVSLVIGSLWR